MIRPRTDRALAAVNGLMVSRASLLADLANAQGQITRQAARVRKLERTLCELLGEQIWREAILGAPADVDLPGCWAGCRRRARSARRCRAASPSNCWRFARRNTPALPRRPSTATEPRDWINTNMVTQIRGRRPRALRPPSADDPPPSRHPSVTAADVRTRPDRIGAFLAASRPDNPSPRARRNATKETCLT